MLILGLDPGLRHTGWGLVQWERQTLSHQGHGVISPPATLPMEERLAHLFQTLRDLVSRHKPHTAAIEETFVNANPGSALKLGMARGVVMMVPATFGLSVTEYAPNTVKKSLVGVGHADKTQMAFMVKRFLPGIVLTQADAGDALALAICHALHVTSPLAFSQTQPGRR